MVWLLLKNNFAATISNLNLVIEKRNKIIDVKFYHLVLYFYSLLLPSFKNVFHCCDWNVIVVCSSPTMYTMFKLFANIQTILRIFNIITSKRVKVLAVVQQSPLRVIVKKKISSSHFCRF